MKKENQYIKYIQSKIQNQIPDENPDITNILYPEEAENEKTIHESFEAQKCESSFFSFYPYPKPPFDKQFYSSKAERIALTRSNFVERKKSLQQRMRIIIFIDIVLFLFIMGIIYPALRKIQTSGRIGNYRFSISQNIAILQSQQEKMALDIIVKVERMADDPRFYAESATQTKSDDSVVFFTQFRYNGKIVGKEQRMLHNNSISYFIFSIPYSKLFQKKSSKYAISNNNLNINIKIGQMQRKFYLSILQER